MELLQRYARKFFPATKYLDYALRVEAYTLTKAANLVMNVDVRPSRTLITPGSQHSYGVSSYASADSLSSCPD